MKLDGVGVKWGKKFHSTPKIFHIYLGLISAAITIIFPSEGVGGTKFPLSPQLLFGIRGGIHVSIPLLRMGF